MPLNNSSIVWRLNTLVEAYLSFTIVLFFFLSASSCPFEPITSLTQNYSLASSVQYLYKVLNYPEFKIHQYSVYLNPEYF